MISLGEKTLKDEDIAGTCPKHTYARENQECHAKGTKARSLAGTYIGSVNPFDRWNRDLPVVPVR